MDRQPILSKINLLKKFLKISNRKPLLKIIKECIILAVVFRSLPRQYFGRYLFKNEITNIKDYLPTKVLGDIKRFFNDRSVVEVLENKLYFNFFYGQFHLNLPKILMYNHLKMFVIGGVAREINTPEGFYEILTELIKINSIDSIFIKSTYGTYGGEKIYKIFEHQLIKERSKIDSLYTEIIKSGYLFQETIKQHPEMDKLNPSCMNTIRMDTFIDLKGNIEVVSAFLRMSIKNSHVDNVSSGGCFVYIDIKTGKLLADGYRGIKQDAGETIMIHPITKVKFEGFVIPFFAEAKDLIIKAAGYMPGLRLIGWDIGIGISGPVLIEGNSDYDLTGNDMAAGGYLSNAVFLKARNEIQHL